MTQRMTVMAAAILFPLVGCSQYSADPPKRDVRAELGGGATEGTDAAETGAVSDIRAIAETYRSLRVVTPEPIDVNREIAALCVPVVPRELLEKAREEHGVHANSAIMIYMNDLAAEAFEIAAPQYPQGAVIVKEKQRLENRSANGAWASEPNGVGGMIKRGPDFDPEHGDWEYFYFEEPDRIESGRIASCIACHAGAKTTDYVLDRGGMRSDPDAPLSQRYWLGPGRSEVMST